VISSYYITDALKAAQVVNFTRSITHKSAQKIMRERTILSPLFRTIIKS